MGIQSVTSCHLGRLFRQAGGIAGLGTEENVEASVAGQNGTQGLGSAGGGGGGGGGGHGFNSGRCRFSFNNFCAVRNKFELDDLHGAGFCRLDDDVAEFGTEGTYQWRTTRVAIKFTVSANSSQDLRRLVGDLEDFWTDVLAGIARDAVFVNPYLCNDCHWTTPCSRCV